MDKQMYLTLNMLKRENFHILPFLFCCNQAAEHLGRGSLNLFFE